MGKFFLRFFLILLIVAASAIIFLSFFGIETDRFDGLIKSKANKVNRYVKLGFQKTKIHINPTELNLVVKLQDPKILVKNNEIILSELDLFLPLRSFFTSDFLLNRAEVAFVKNDIKDLTKITGIFLPKFINKKLNKIFNKGNLEGELIIPFESDGSIGKDYGFYGKVSDASINLTKEFSIEQLTTEISHVIDAGDDGFKITVKKGFIHDLELADSTINLKRKKNETKVKSLLRTKGKLNFSQIKKISTLFALNIDNLKDVNGIVDLKTNINFDLGKQFKIGNLSYSIEGDIAYSEIHTEERRIIKKYLPEFDSKRIPSPLSVSAIPCKEANVNNCAKAGTFETLKSLIIKFELETSFEITDSYSNFPPSKPFIKSKFFTNGLALSEITCSIFFSLST